MVGIYEVSKWGKLSQGKRIGQERLNNKKLNIHVISDGITRLPILEGEISHIELPRDQKSLGLTIVGGSDTPLRCVVVQEIFTDGLVAQDGRLQPGDQIIEVDGVDMTTATHQQVCDALRKSIPVLRLGVYRERIEAYKSSPSSLASSSNSTASSSEVNFSGHQYYEVYSSRGTDPVFLDSSAGRKHYDVLTREETIIIPLDKNFGRNLGVKLGERRSDPGIFIVEIVPESLAEKDNRLTVHDRVLYINGEDVRCARLEEAFMIMHCSQDYVSFIVSRLIAFNPIEEIRGLSQGSSTRENISSTCQESVSNTREVTSNICRDAVSNHREKESSICQESVSSHRERVPSLSQESIFGYEENEPSMTLGGSSCGSEYSTVDEDTVTLGSTFSQGSPVQPIPTGIPPLEETVDLDSAQSFYEATKYYQENMKPNGWYPVPVYDANFIQPKSRHSAVNSLSQVFGWKKEPINTLHQKQVRLTKGFKEGLGMRIGGGLNSNEGDTPIYVANINGQGPAGKSRQIKKGDVVLSVNNNSLLGLTHTQAVSLLKSTSEMVAVTLTLLEGPETCSGSANFVPSWLYWQRLPRSLHISKSVILYRPPGSSLGFSIVGGNDPRRGPEPIHVLFVVSTSPAAIDGRLRCGDRLLAVDGHCLESVSHSMAVSLLKQAGERVSLEVVSWMGTEL